MAAGTVEERLSAMETELQELKQQIRDNGSEEISIVPWWEQRFGAFAGSKEYEEAERAGREYRESQRDYDAESDETP